MPSCTVAHYRFFGQFLADAHTGALPAYSFIEPQYFTDLLSSRIPNDQHPPHNVLYGERLIAAVYNAVRSSPCWKRALLIITYDEHGGCCDHVVPPPAVSPDGAIDKDDGFNFTTYGVRVPAVIVSPWIAPGSKVRPPQRDEGPPFDHASIIKTVRELFSLGPQLTTRDNVAPSLVSALNLAAPNNDGPGSLTAALDAPTPDLLVARGAAPPNGMQQALAPAAAVLPDTPPATDDLVPAAQPLADPSRYPTVALAQVAAVAGVKDFLGLP